MDRYRKVAEDAATSTLQQHDTGHTVTIAHKALPREQRSYLKALPLYSADKADPEQAHAKSLSQGGKVNPSYGDAIETRGDKEKMGESEDVNSNPKYKEQVAQTLQSKYYKDNKKPRGDQKLSQAMRAHYDDGTPNEPVSKSDAPNPSATPININIGGGGSGPMPQAVQSPNLLPQVAKEQLQAPPQQVAPQQEEELPVPQEAPPLQPGQGDASLSDAQKQIDQLSGKMTSQTDAQPESAQQLNTQGPAEPSYLGGVGQEYKGLVQGAQAAGALGQEQAGIEHQAIRDRQALMKHTQDAYDVLNTERLKNESDVRNGQVNPAKYWDNHSKTMTGLGLILAGFNPTNHPNGALEFLQHNIAQDIEAQRANLGSKENLLAHTIQQFGNARAGADFANVILTDQVAAKIREAAGKAQNAIQAGQLNNMAGQLQQSSAQKMVPLSAMQGAFQAMRNGVDPSQMLPGLRLAQPEMAKTVEEHHLPGIGATGVPVTPAVRDQFLAKQQLNDRLNDLYQWSASHSGEIKGLNQNDINTGMTKAANVQNLYRDAMNGGVFKKGEQEFIGSIIDSDPTKFFNSVRVLPQLQEAINGNNASLDVLKHAYQVTPYSNAVKPATPSTPATDTSQIQMKDGKPYRKVPGGWVPA